MKQVAPSKTILCFICSKESFFFINVDQFAVYRCKHCGHGFISPPPSQEQLGAFYNSAKSDISNGDSFRLLQTYVKNASDVHCYYRQQLNLTRNILRGMKKSDPRVLEIGCSCGVFLRCLMDIGYTKVRGIDINPQAVEAGRRALGVEMEAMPVEALATKQKFDLILAFALFEHLVDPKALLGTLKDHLEEDGAVLFVVPNFNSLIRYCMGKKWLWYMPPAHLQYFTIQSMKTMAQRKGLQCQLTTGNIGTYLYLIYCLLLGVPRYSSGDQEGKSSHPGISYKLFRIMDNVLRFFLFPVILSSELFNQGPHIIGLIKKP